MVIKTVSLLSLRKTGKGRTGTGWDSTSASADSSIAYTPVKQDSAALTFAKQLKLKVEIDGDAMDKKFQEIFTARKNTIETLKNMVVGLEQEQVWLSEQFKEMWDAQDETTSGLSNLIDALENSL